MQPDSGDGWPSRARGQSALPNPKPLWELPQDTVLFAIAALLSPAQLGGVLREQGTLCEEHCPISEAMTACRGRCPIAEQLDALVATSASKAIAHVRELPMMSLAEYWQRARHDLGNRSLVNFCWALSCDPRWELETLRERVARELTIRALRAIAGDDRLPQARGQ